MREELVRKLRDRYDHQLLKEVDKDFLEFEEEMAREQDLQDLLWLIENKHHLDTNPHNSILLYVTGVTSEFDAEKERSDTIDGTPPDIDLDFDSVLRGDAINWVAERWGRDNVAHINTFSTFKPKGLIRKFYSVTEGDKAEMKKLLDKVPKAVYGEEPTWEMAVNANEELNSSEDYEFLRRTGSQLDNMVTHFGYHAAGVVISDTEISDVVPVYKTKKAERITQFDMKEVENLGLIKFDFLGIDTMTLLSEMARQVKDNQGIDIDIYDIPDNCPKTKRVLKAGLTAGLFQLETSDTARDLVQMLEPANKAELAVPIALNRPGPLQAGLHHTYADNKNAGYDLNNLPGPVAEVLEDTYWTLVYQEQIMDLFSKVAGLTLQESDDARRALGKKIPEVLAQYKDRFINGFVNHSGVDKKFAEEFWIILAGDEDDDENNGFADYCFAGDTLIKTPWGNMTIEYMVDNEVDTVYAYPVTKRETLLPVTQWHRRGKRETSTFTFEDGSTVTCTPDHKFLCKSKTGALTWAPISWIYFMGLEMVTSERQFQ